MNIDVQIEFDCAKHAEISAEMACYRESGTHFNNYFPGVLDTDTLPGDWLNANVAPASNIATHSGA